MSTSRLRLFVACAPGLEGLLAAEAAQVWPDDEIRRVRGGVTLFAPTEALWHVVTRVRCAETVRVRIGRFEATSFFELEQGLARVPFHAWIPREAAVDVRAAARRSKLIHTGAIEERVRAHLVKHRAVTEGTDQRVSLRVEQDHVTVSVDATRADHHRHGERASVGKASLRETLAAALARALGTAPAPAVWDPFCGAGTTLIEVDALWRGRRIPMRDLPMLSWPVHDADAFARWLDDAPPSPEPASAYIGSDTDARELDAAKDNAAAAGMLPATTWFHGDFAGALDQVPVGAALISNTPYGHRAGRGHDLGATFGRLGAALRARPDLERVVVLAGWRGFADATGCRWETIATLTNRGLPVAILRLAR